MSPRRRPPPPKDTPAPPTVAEPAAAPPDDAAATGDTGGRLHVELFNDGEQVDGSEFSFDDDDGDRAVAACNLVVPMMACSSGASQQEPMAGLSCDLAEASTTDTCADERSGVESSLGLESVAGLILTPDNRSLTAVELDGVIAADDDLIERVVGYLRAAKAPNTRRGYASDWRAFESWCARKGAMVLPASAQTVASYLADRASSGGIADDDDAPRPLRPSTLVRHLAAISMAHRAAAFASPTQELLVRTTIAGIRRTHGTAVVKKTPVLVGELCLLVPTLGDDLVGVRDRALLLLGFATALRRSEIAALDVSDLENVAEGLLVRVRWSKTDQDGQGREIAVGHGAEAGTCPVLATRAWIDRAHLVEGPLFRAIDRHGRMREHRLSGKAVAAIVKRRVSALGLDPARFGGHSLRSGFATSAAQAGVAEAEIAEVTGHRSIAVLRGYVRRGRAFTAAVVRRLGL